MSNESEEWNARQWMACLTLREKVMGDYLVQLRKYNGLPAAEQLIERELLKKYSGQTLNETFEAILPPASTILHEWDRLDHPEMGGEEMDEEEGEEVPESREARLGETCYTGITDIINGWVECLKTPMSPLNAKFALAVLGALSQVGCYIFAASSAEQPQYDARTCALIQLSINKCILIEQCLHGFSRELQGISELQEAMQNAISRLEMLSNLLNEFLSEVLTPGNKN